MNSIEVAIDSFGPSAHVHAFALEQAMIKGGIESPLEKAHFLAQLAHESGGFKRVEENLNYSYTGLLKTFKKYFPTEKLAKEYERRPSKIASRVYANRYGNRDEASGDGWNYRGRCLIQLTFLDNYNAASIDIFGDDRLVDTPQLALDTQTGADICMWYWKTKKCRDAALQDNIELVTKRINGGLNGLEDRKVWLSKFKKLFS